MCVCVYLSVWGWGYYLIVCGDRVNYRVIHAAQLISCKKRKKSKACMCGITLSLSVLGWCAVHYLCVYMTAVASTKGIMHC